MRIRDAFAAALVVVAMTASTGAHSAGVEEFYKGRTDFADHRLQRRHRLRHLCASARALHRPAHPGPADGHRAEHAGRGQHQGRDVLYGVAPKDGSVLATIGRSAPLEPLLGDAQFDGRTFAWLGSIASNSSLCATWHATAIKTWQDVLTKPFALAGEGSGSDPDNFARILKNVFGAKVRLVTGYPGGSEMNLAIERGEVDGRCGWSWDSIKSTRPDWLRDRKLNLLAVFSLQKAADIPPRVPLIGDLAGERRAAANPARAAGRAVARPAVSSPRPASRRIARPRCGRPSTPP